MAMSEPQDSLQQRTTPRPKAPTNELCYRHRPLCSSVDLPCRNWQALQSVGGLICYVSLQYSVESCPYVQSFHRHFHYSTLSRNAHMYSVEKCPYVQFFHRFFVNTPAPCVISRTFSSDFSSLGGTSS